MSPALLDADHFSISGYMEKTDLSLAVSALASLAQATRLEVFRLLVAREPDGLAAGELARELSVPQNTLSSHLGILARADLVTSERRSRSIIYRAKLATFQKLILFMIHDCCGGRAELCAPLVAHLTPVCQLPVADIRKSAKAKRRVARS